MKIDLEKIGFTQITRAQWKKLERIRRALEPVKAATSQFQSEALSLNDFFIVWMKCYEATNSIGSKSNDS